MGGSRLASIVPEAPTWNDASIGSMERAFEWAAEATTAKMANSASETTPAIGQAIGQVTGQRRMNERLRPTLITLPATQE